MSALPLESGHFPAASNPSASSQKRTSALRHAVRYPDEPSALGSAKLKLNVAGDALQERSDVVLCGCLCARRIASLQCLINFEMLV
jgi:hypothetical protein